jgi:predicted nucleic acid-binding protein
MARTVVADSGFLVAFLSGLDSHNRWAVTVARRYPPPWHTCEAVLSEIDHVLGPHGLVPVAALLRSRALVASFRLDDELDRVLKLMERYSNVPMSVADACVVRMTETASDSMVLTTDNDFRIYRRHGRLAIPAMLPP